MNEYQKGIPSMCTRAFWEEVFEEYGCLDEKDIVDSSQCCVKDQAEDSVENIPIGSAQAGRR
jgi:hypothetical protein